MLREVTQVDPEVLQEVEDIENLLFENSFNATTLGNELRAGARLWVEGAHCIEGYMIVRTVNGLTDILRLGVRPPYQRLGLGSAMLREVLETSSRVMLSVRKPNVDAIKLYRRLGFQITGDLGDSWTMQFTSPAS
jgi:ribosomal protein S18 acetylase RimI-like enzyme